MIRLKTFGRALDDESTRALMRCADSWEKAHQRPNLVMILSAIVLNIQVFFWQHYGHIKCFFIEIPAATVANRKKEKMTIHKIPKKKRKYVFVWGGETKILPYYVTKISSSCRNFWMGDDKRGLKNLTEIFPKDKTTGKSQKAAYWTRTFFRRGENKQKKNCSSFCISTHICIFSRSRRSKTTYSRQMPKTLFCSPFPFEILVEELWMV